MCCCSGIETAAPLTRVSAAVASCTNSSACRRGSWLQRVELLDFALRKSGTIVLPKSLAACGKVGIRPAHSISAGICRFGVRLV